jgi:hypothetical protein
MGKLTARVLSKNNTYEYREMDDSELVDMLLKGASLRTFMIPDSSIPSNYPEHIESYDLPHVIINGTHFWAKSETAHLAHSLGSEYRYDSVAYTNAAFCYTDMGNIFFGYNPKLDRVVLMSKKRYKEHVWHITENYKMIWDSGGEHCTEVVKKEIELCSKFKVAMLDADNVWNIHPVDLPMYYSAEGAFQLKTTMDEYPMLFRDPSETDHLLSRYRDFFNTKPADNKKGMIPLNSVRKFYTFYSFSSDGSYYNLFDIQRNTTQTYKRLKVFVDRTN